MLFMNQARIPRNDDWYGLLGGTTRLPGINFI